MHVLLKITATLNERMSCETKHTRAPAYCIQCRALCSTSRLAWYGTPTWTAVMPGGTDKASSSGRTDARSDERRLPAVALMVRGRRRWMKEASHSGLARMSRRLCCGGSCSCEGCRRYRQALLDGVSIFMACTLCEPPLKCRYSRLRQLSLKITLTIYIYSIFYTRVRSGGYKELRFGGWQLR